MRTRVVALKAQTGRRERHHSSPQPGSRVQPLVETTPGRTPRPAPPAAPRTGTRRLADPGTGIDPEAERDDPGDPPSREAGRRRTLLAALGVTAAASAAALVVGLPNWSPDRSGPARPLNTAEAQRLAAMRVTNYRDVRAGVRVTVGAGAHRTELVGWVDWARPLAYVNVGGPGAGTDRGLVQATRSAVVARPEPAAAATPAPPPLVPPTDRWRLRDLPATRGLPAALDLLLSLGADQPEPAPAPALWVGSDTDAGTPVDIVQAPLPDAAGATAADRGREARFWLDRDARLHRLEGRLPDDTPVTVELERTDRPTLRPVDALGGRPGLPRTLTDAEAARLTRLPARLRIAGGAALTLTAPLGPTSNLRGAGWLNWADPTAYLAVRDLDTPRRHTLLHLRTGRLARAETTDARAAAAEFPARPPLPPPSDVSWTTPAPVRDDLGRLVDAALRAAGTPAGTGSALRLRADRLADRTVDVIELRARGAELRYWIDRAGLLRRVELRTVRGTWAQLDLTPGRVPTLPSGRSGSR